MKLLPLTRTVVCLTVLLVVALCAPALLAQEEAEEDDDSWLGSWYAEIEAWVAQAAGMGYSPATEVDPLDGTRARQLAPAHGTESKLRYRVTYELPKKWGDLVITYFTHDEGVELDRLNPGQFVYRENLTNDLFAGFGNDGLADGFFFEAETDLRDLRLDLRRPAFRSSKLSGEWYFGWRRVVHKRSQDVIYLALAPDLPPLIPPAADCGTDCDVFDPIPDVASLGSRFEGRGVTVGIDLDFALWKNKLSAEAGAAFSVLRGKTDTDFTATNSFYMLDTPCDEFDAFLGPPYDEFAGTFDCGLGSGVQSNLDFISQETIDFGVQSESVSSTADVLETYIGFRYRIRRWIELYAGFRNTRYSNVGVDLTQSSFSTSPTDEDVVFDPTVEDGFKPNFQNVTETHRSATYEGFYGGVRFRLY